MSAEPVVADALKRKPSKMEIALRKASNMFRRREIQHRMVFQPMASDYN